ncbi:NLPA lipofamily protein [Chlamydia psittaci 09DC77]|nr:NLPA lipofamily protein [Chlamydia psittaci 09DC77]
MISYKEASHLDITAKDVFGCGGKKVTILEIAAPLLVSSLPDVDAAVIPGNFAIARGIYPYKNSLYLEDVHTSKYTNVVVIRAEDMEDSRMQKLQQLLQSRSVKDFFDAKYQGIFLLQ